MGSSLLIYSQFACILLVIILGFYVHANRGYSMLVPGKSPMCRILADWAMYSYYPMSKEELVLYCYTVWPMYILDGGDKGP